MRLSDIFKQPSQPGAVAPTPPAPPAREAPPPPPAGEPLTPEKPPPPPGDAPRRLHQQLLSEMRGILERLRREEQIPAEPLLQLMEEIIQSFLLYEELWIGFAHVESEPAEFLITHPVNVTILSLTIGRGVGYRAERLKQLAVKAYLHDIGMLKLGDLVSQPRTLTPEEQERLKQHPVHSAELIEQFIPGVGKGVCYAILQDHERMSGGGYPQNLHNGEIEEDMRIIGMVDVYEALTHTRSWRERMTPRQAIEHLLSPAVKDQFDPMFLRLLVTQVGIYPACTWVALSTGESGRIVKTNPKAPLRPVVDILLDAQGNTLPEPRRLDLLQHPTVFIKDSAGYEGTSR